MVVYDRNLKRDSEAPMQSKSTARKERPVHETGDCMNPTNFRVPSRHMALQPIVLLSSTFASFYHVMMFRRRFSSTPNSLVEMSQAARLQPPTRLGTTRNRDRHAVKRRTDIVRQAREGELGVIDIRNIVSAMRTAASRVTSPVPGYCIAASESVRKFTTSLPG